MELTKAERLLLANLLEVRALVEGSDDWRPTIKALQNGYAPFYPGDEIDDELSSVDTTFVLDTLQMYDWLQWVLKDADDGLSNAAVFPGFDANNQGALYGFARFLTDDMQRFPGLKRAQGMNSHGSQPDYSSMLDAYRQRPPRDVGPTPKLDDLEHARVVLAAGR